MHALIVLLVTLPRQFPAHYSQWSKTLALRAGHSAYIKLDVVLRLAQSITPNRGEADPNLVAAFFAADYSELALIELVELVILRIFTNYVYAMTKVP